MLSGFPELSRSQRPEGVRNPPQLVPTRRVGMLLP